VQIQKNLAEGLSEDGSALTVTAESRKGNTSIHNYALYIYHSLSYIHSGSICIFSLFQFYL